MDQIARRISLIPFLIILGLKSTMAAQTEAGLTLLEPSSARLAALGESGVALQNDVAALALNPATLSTLKSGHLSLLYQKGLSNDSFGHIAIGAPSRKISWGTSVGFYNSGTISAYDGVTQQSLVGQRDIAASLGISERFNFISLGLNGKFFHSEIAERASAQSFLLDVGGHMALHSRLALGASIQNLGGPIRYVSESEEPPRIARFGLSWLALPGRYSTTIFADEIYHADIHKSGPSIGIETLLGPLAVRAGYKSGREREEFTVGTGFSWTTTTLDYAFGFVQDLSSTHRVSLSARFGGASAAQSPIVKKKDEEEIPSPPIPALQLRPVYEVARPEGFDPRSRIYSVREGDTLKSIAKTFYGKDNLWDELYRANQHLITDPENLIPGKKIIIPVGFSQ